MMDQINRILDALPAPIKSRLLAVILWTSCEFGAGNGAAGLIRHELTPKILDEAANILQLKHWQKGKRAGLMGALSLLELPSECPLIDTVLRQLERSSLEGAGTPTEFVLYHS